MFKLPLRRERTSAVAIDVGGFNLETVGPPATEADVTTVESRSLFLLPVFNQ